MKTIMIAVLVGLGTAVSALAATPFETLKALYDSASVPAVATDFDLSTDNDSNQACVMALRPDAELTPVYVVRYQVTISGQPSNGPLFPGTPDTSTDLLLANSLSRTGLDAYLGSLQGVTHLDTSATDLVLTVGHTNSYADSPIEMRFRRSGDLISFRAMDYIGSDDEKVIYGYCYRK